MITSSAGQADHQRSAPAPVGVNLDRATVIRDDTVADAETETRAGVEEMCSVRPPGRFSPVSSLENVRTFLTMRAHRLAFASMSANALRMVEGASRLQRSRSRSSHACRPGRSRWARTRWRCRSAPPLAFSRRPPARARRPWPSALRFVPSPAPRARRGPPSASARPPCPGGPRSGPSSRSPPPPATSSGSGRPTRRPRRRCGG